MNEQNEQLAAKFRAEIRSTNEGKPEGTRESLRRVATMLNSYAVSCFPANDLGQVDFVRAIMESTADEIIAFLEATEIKENKCTN